MTALISSQNPTMFSYTLYGEDESLITAAIAYGTGFLTPDDNHLKALYDSYILKIYCDTNTATPVGSGCCLLEPEKGGFCLTNINPYAA